MSEPTKMAVFSRLQRSSGHYVSGEALCKEIDVSRTAVWKAINSLRHDGYTVESLPGQGYRLVGSPSDLTYERICTELAKYGDWSVYYYPSIDSTNEIAKKLARETAKNGDIVVADIQTSGKGRMGRRWESPGGTGLWFSIILRPSWLSLMHASQIVPAVALGLLNGIQETLSITAEIKWPNDIFIDGKKVCGILTEIGAELDRISYAVVGIGINVNKCSGQFSPAIENSITALQDHYGETIDRSSLLAFLVQNVINWCSKLQNNEWGQIIDDFKAHSYTLNKYVSVLLPDGNTFGGIAHDIDEDGSLVIRCNDGSYRKVLAGDVSIRHQTTL